MRKYFCAYALALQNDLQLRASLAMDRIGGIAVMMTLYFFWSALLPAKGDFLGYGHAQMLSYVLAMSILRSFVFTGRGWNLVHEIATGRISGTLVRPIDYRGLNLAMDFAGKTIHLAAAMLEVSLLIVILRAPVYFPARASSWLLFALATVMSSLIFFLMEFAVSSLAFWTSESGGPLFCFELFLQFAAGAFFPLDVLPTSIKTILNLTPFPYMVFFPINIYLERLSSFKAAQILGVQAAWLLLIFLATDKLWQRGLASYAAEGG